MKKFFVIVLCFLLVLTGCTEKDIDKIAELIPTTTKAPDSQEIPSNMDEPLDPTELLAVSVPAATEVYALDDGTQIFTYTAQHMQLIHPNEIVADRVILDFLNRVDAAQLDAGSILTAAKADYSADENWYPYFYQVIYSPTRIDHGVLSLFGTQNSYSGALHGSLSCVAANYDLSTGDVLTLGSIMHMDATKEGFIDIIIAKLDDIASSSDLFDDYEEGVRSRLSGDENLYEDFYFTNTGLTFFFSPYEIAPYSSGVITVEIPYEELPGLLYDGYFPAERDQVQGKMRIGSFMKTNMEQFESMAEVTLATGEEIMVVYPEGVVEDIRVTIAGDDMNMPEYTVFAALEMSSNNAVVLSLSEDMLPRVSIRYSASDISASIPLS